MRRLALRDRSQMCDRPEAGGRTGGQRASGGRAPGTARAVAWRRPSRTRARSAAAACSRALTPAGGPGTAGVRSLDADLLELSPGG